LRRFIDILDFFGYFFADQKSDKNKQKLWFMLAESIIFGVSLYVDEFTGQYHSVGCRLIQALIQQLLHSSGFTFICYIYT